jgi:hypothetical protein
LNSNNAFGTEIETYLVQYLLVAICAEYEKAIEEMVMQRIARAGDARITSLVQGSLGMIFRGLTLSNITGLLGKLDTNLKDEFKAGITNTPAHVALDSIVSNRDNVAHVGGVQVTFPELRKFYDESKHVIEKCAEILGKS